MSKQEDIVIHSFVHVVLWKKYVINFQEISNK